MRMRRHSRGMLLVQMIVYVAVLGIVMNVAGVLYYRYTRSSIGLARNTSDILRTTQAGERWREDIRRALQAEATLDGQILTAKQRAATVRYRFAKGSVWRQGKGDRGWVLVLAKVRSSRMLRDTRNGVESWRWEVELESSRKPRIRPLFTFRAVPLAQAAPAERGGASR